MGLPHNLQLNIKRGNSRKIAERFVRIVEDFEIFEIFLFFFYVGQSENSSKKSEMVDLSSQSGGESKGER